MRSRSLVESLDGFVLRELSKHEGFDFLRFSFECSLPREVLFLAMASDGGLPHFIARLPKGLKGFLVLKS